MNLDIHMMHFWKGNSEVKAGERKSAHHLSKLRAKPM
jgi:hypothetical protein